MSFTNVLAKCSSFDCHIRKPIFFKIISKWVFLHVAVDDQHPTVQMVSYPLILRIMGFFSSSFSRNIYHHWFLNSPNIIGFFADECSELSHGVCFCPISQGSFVQRHIGHLLPNIPTSAPQRCVGFSCFRPRVPPGPRHVQSLNLQRHRRSHPVPWRQPKGKFLVGYFFQTHTIHVWYIYLHLPTFGCV